MPVSEGTNYMMRIFGSAAGARAHRNRFYCAALFLFLFATALYTFGQEATIVGTITDPSGAAVPGAAVVITDRETGQPRGFGFVEMVTEESAQKAVAELNAFSVEGRNLTVNEARPKTERRSGDAVSADYR